MMIPLQIRKQTTKNKQTKLEKNPDIYTTILWKNNAFIISYKFDFYLCIFPFLVLHSFDNMSLRDGNHAIHFAIFGV